MGEKAVIDASEENSAWVQDGGARVIGENDAGQCDTGDWTNIVAVALGTDHVVG